MTGLELSKQRLQKAKGKSLVDLLKKEGIELTDTGSYYRCLSPLRTEGNGSFDINKRSGKWHDRGNGKKGDILDYVMLQKGLSLMCAVDFLLGDNSLDIPVYVPEKREKDSIEVSSIEPLSDPRLISFAKSRMFNMDVATKWLHQAQVSFPYGKNPNRSYSCLAWKNDSGGYEFRGTFLKVSNAPKNITTIKGVSTDNVVMLFEGNPDFLSYLTFYGFMNPQYDTIVLNSLSFLGAILPMLQGKMILWYGQNDKASERAYRRLKREGIVVTDKRWLYKEYKDFNEFLVGSSVSKMSKLLNTVYGKE
jgi:hypothetical protein